jgi:hypothetical protein
MKIRTPRGLGLTVLFAMVALVALVASLGMTPAPVGAQDAAQAWLHVQITGGDDTKRMNVNVPLSAAAALLAMAPPEVIAEGEAGLAARGISVSALREMWAQLKELGDAEFVTIEEEDETIRIARVADQIEIAVRDTEDDETLNVEIPVTVVDRLLTGSDDTLNIAAVLEPLRGLRGDIVRVRESDRQVRVWIDEVATQ